MIVRIFDTSVDPGDVELGKQLFRDEVRPAFLEFEGCHGIEMLIGVEEHSGDLVEIAAISRWDSVDAIESATKTPEYERGAGRASASCSRRARSSGTSNRSTESVRGSRLRLGDA